MRNLKKILALVLAMVMVVGVMSVATAATPGTSYSDDASITTYDEAVQVLDQLGIYRGNEKGEFMPNSSITRAEVAALVYRIVHQDVTDKYVGIYADYNKFADVDEDDWFAGYVNYCANGEYIVGDGNGNFIPEGEVNGYQVLAIMLRALGYDREGEFQGTGWEIRTARKAKELGITANITEGTLGAPASRELVAELIFKAMLCDVVDWSLLTSYYTTEYTLTLGETNFGLSNRSAVGADDKYGEPVVTWDSIYGAESIEVRFNPIAKYTSGVTCGTIYTLLSALDPYKTGTITVVGAEDGYTGTTTVDKGCTEVVAGKGAVAEVFVADGVPFVVVKNTYVDTVASVYSTTWGTLFSLTSGTTVNYPYAAAPAVGTVVTFTQYQNIADVASLKAAETKTVRVTNTYDTDNNASSYILVGSAKYEYDCNFAGNYLADEILDRDELYVKGEVDDLDQVLYFDEYGYVVYTRAVGDSANEYGYLLVVNSTYGGYLADNGYVNTFTAYTMDGQKVTVKGAEEAFCYANKESAQDYTLTIGIYAYEKNADGLYNLTKSEGAVYTGYGAAGAVDITVDSILAGDAGALGYGTDAVLNDNTVFVIANYNKNGLISGYTVKKGFKAIDDLEGGLGYDMNGDPIVFGGEFLNDADTNTYGVDFVFVTGAEEVENEEEDITNDKVFYLVDATPEKYVTTYDTHTVISGGKLGTMKFAVDAVADNGMVEEHFYAVTKTSKGYVAEVEEVETDTGVFYAAAGVLYVSTTGEFITMADNCVIYNINSTTGAVTTLTAADVAWIGWAWNYGLVYNLDNTICVAAQNQYGYATVIYVVDGVYYY